MRRSTFDQGNEGLAVKMIPRTLDMNLRAHDFMAKSQGTGGA